MKEALYNFLSGHGVKILTMFFPEYFARQPLKPTDRYIEYPFVVKNLPLPPARLLDVGCAGSFFPLILAGFGYKVYGIDLREYAVINRIQFENFSFKRGDICKAPFPDAYFDVVTLVSTIEHIGIVGRYGADNSRLKNDKLALKEVGRLLKRGGTVLLTIPVGKEKIIKGYLRIYDKQRIEYIADGFEISAKEFYMQDKDDDWVKVDENTATAIDVVSPGRYPLCLLKLLKR